MDPEQLSLFELRLPREQRPAETPYARLRRRLADHLEDHGEASLGRLVLTDNRSTVLSSRPMERGRLDVRLHWSFAEAPDPVLAAVARVLGGPRRGAALRRAREVVRGWISEHRESGAEGPPEGLGLVVPAPRRAPEAPRPARGRIHDLPAIRDEVNRRYFGDRLEVAIAWARHGRPRGRRRRRRAVVKLGSWSPQDRTVRIHPVLDHPSVPRLVVASIVHHELLHAELEPEVRNGRRRLHTPEFRRREREFEGYAEARRWIDRHLGELDRRRARTARSLLVAVPVLATLLLPPQARAEGAAPGPQPGVERVARLCEAWTAARYLHPSLAYRDVDWDAAFVEAAPRAWGAGTPEEYRETAAAMLAALDDPATEVVAEEAPETPFEPGEPPPLFRWPEEGVLLVDVARFQRVAGPYALYPALLRGFPPELEKARALVFDLRIPPETSRSQDWSDRMLAYVAGNLVPEEVRGGSERWLVHWGFRPQEGTTSGGYRSAFAESLAQVHVPEAEEPVRRPVVFLVNERTKLPDVALALQGAGLGKVVAVGPLTDRRLVERVAVDLGEGLEARIRAGEIVPPTGTLRADLEVEPAAGDRDPGLEAALALLDEPWEDPAETAAGAAEATPPAAAARWRPDRRYADMTEPDLGHRLLAGCRAWGVIHHFYPYLHLLDDWDGAFRRSLPELAAAEDGEAYVRAVLRLMAHVEDGHTSVWGHPDLVAVRGESLPPVRIREIEGRMVVTHLYDSSIQALHVGDEIHAVDGRPVEERIDALWPFVTASRPEIRRLAAFRWSLGGSEGSRVVLTVSGADGVRREVEVERSPGDRRAEEPAEDPWRVLEDTGDLEVGYVDLTELQVPQVEPMLAELAGTDAIVFDMRGYPHGTAWPLAPRLNVKGTTEWAVFRRREVSHESFGMEDSGYFFVQRIPDADVEPYRGRVVMLINDRAISQAEHTALAFEQVADTVFVGTPTAGANGDVTSFFLPGGIDVYFTGHDVRHADGRQLQRVGILPDVEAAPTLAGFRAGRDEVLERAVEYLLATPSR